MPHASSTHSQEVPVGSYFGMVRATAARFPDAVAIVLDDTRVTYATLVDAAEAKTRQLRALGLVKGDVIGLLMPNSLELVDLFLGAAMLGIVVVPMNIRFRAFETAHILRDAAIKVVFTTAAIDHHLNFKELLAEVLPGLNEQTNPLALRIAGFPDLRAIVHSGVGTPATMIDADDLAAIAQTCAITGDLDEPCAEDIQLYIYTSGTTAAPKGCMLPNRCLVVTAQLTSQLFKIGPEDTWWCPLPMFHVGGLLFMSVCLAVGARFVGMSHFNVEQAFTQFRREKPSVLYPLFPTILLPLLEHSDFTTVDFSAVRYLFQVAPAELQRRAQAALPNALLLSAYGMSETTGIVAFGHPSDTLDQRTTTVGHFLPGWTAKIVDPETRKEVAAGQPGEIAVRGPGLFVGYLNHPQLTANAHDLQGYFHTGDFGSRDAAGLLQFLGRLKDQMKVGGENVSALEVEAFLATHPAVRLAQVIPLPDERYGEVPAAFVEIAPGAVISEADILEFCTGRIARYKIPRHVRFVEEWPMSATKIAKFKLRDALMQELGGR